MKKRKNYGRKIKRSKINLYPKRKTKAQKILGTVLLIIIILAVVFLGYCLGKPLLEYFKLNTDSLSSDGPAWTPPADSLETETSYEASPESADAATSANTSAAQTTTPAEKTDIYSVSVPVSALSNSASLSAFASKAVTEGYTAAAVNLKDSSGYLLYTSQLEVVKDSEIILGMLSAKEICDILNQNGLTPVARLSVLSDNEGCRLNPDMCYKIADEPEISWLDYYTTGEPLRWSNPEAPAAAEYNNAIVAEIKAAGFKNIVLTDIIFPEFQEYDKEFLSLKYFAADRYKMLTAVVSENTALLVRSDDIILNNMSGSAEVLKNKSSLSTNTVIVSINRGSFAEAGGYPAGAEALLEDIMAQASAKCAGMSLSPMVSRTEFSEVEIEQMKSAAEKLGYKDFYVG